jgi:hypothetical protein
MVPFAGFNMPVQYSNLIQEHLAVRNNVGVFDVSHMGEFLLKGEKALDLIQLVTSNDASSSTTSNDVSIITGQGNEFFCCCYCHIVAVNTLFLVSIYNSLAWNMIYMLNC